MISDDEIFGFCCIFRIGTSRFLFFKILLNNMDHSTQSDPSELFNVASTLESMKDEEVQKLYQELLAKGSEEAKPNQEQGWSTVRPTPGRCIKTRNAKTKEKVFINICISSTVPAPANISEMELLKMLDELEDPNQIVDYRVPMSVGAAHAELDNRGKGCTAYDIIISPSFLHTILNSKTFLGFFMSIVFEAISTKYEVELERNWIMLKAKKFLGKVDEQNVRTKKLIQEVSSNDGLASSVTTKAERPEFDIIAEPENNPEFLIAEIQLPNVASAKSIILDVGEDRLVLCTRPKQYELDIYLPYNLNQEECGSQFDLRTRILTVTMPVALEK